MNSIFQLRILVILKIVWTFKATSGPFPKNGVKMFLNKFGLFITTQNFWFLFVLSTDYLTLHYLFPCSVAPMHQVCEKKALHEKDRNLQNLPWKLQCLLIFIELHYRKYLAFVYSLSWIIINIIGNQNQK